MASISSLNNYPIRDPENFQMSRRAIHVKRKQDGQVSPIHNPPSPVAIKPEQNPIELEQIQKQIKEIEQALEAKNQQNLTFSAFLTYATSIAGFSALNSYTANHLLPSLSSRGVCLANILPQSVIDFSTVLGSTIGSINDLFFKMFPAVFPETLIKAACEEVEFRWFVQEILLKKIPQKALEKISPNLIPTLIDSTPARVTRVAATAIFFAMLHHHVLECEAGGGLAQLMGGLAFGGIYEISDGTLLATINIHCIYNVLCGFFGA